MNNKTPQVYKEIELGELLPEVQSYKTAGWRFAQLCASTIEGGVEICYTFSMGSGSQYENLLLNVENGVHVPSITGYYGEAFVFENEMHELFGVLVDGISIDFKGNFYRISLTTPMNPDAAPIYEAEMAKQAAEAAPEEAEDEEAEADGEAADEVADEPAAEEPAAEEAAEEPAAEPAPAEKPEFPRPAVAKKDPADGEEA